MAIRKGDVIVAGHVSFTVDLVVTRDGRRLARAARQDIASIEVSGAYAGQRYHLPLSAVTSVKRVGLVV